MNSSMESVKDSYTIKNFKKLSIYLFGIFTINIYLLVCYPWILDFLNGLEYYTYWDGIQQILAY